LLDETRHGSRKAGMTVSKLEQLVDALGCCKLTLWARADARGTRPDPQKSVLYLLYLTEAKRLASVVQPDFSDAEWVFRIHATEARY
jgi:hypothetical protein